MDRHLQKFRLTEPGMPNNCTRRWSSGHVETEFVDMAGIHPKIKLRQSWIIVFSLIRKLSRQNPSAFWLKCIFVIWVDFRTIEKKTLFFKNHADHGQERRDSLYTGFSFK